MKQLNARHSNRKKYQLKNLKFMNNSLEILLFAQTNFINFMKRIIISCVNCFK